MAIIKFKTTQYAGMFLRQPIQLLQLLTTLVTPQRGDNGYNFLLGQPNDFGTFWFNVLAKASGKAERN